MNRRIMKKMIKEANKKGMLLYAYPTIVKYCEIIGISESEISEYMRDKYGFSIEEI